MPTLVNGIGTHYRGKLNVSSRQGTCSACKREATLVSYDTKLSFVIFFVRIFSLGEKHIIDQCSICGRHGVLPLAEWKEIKSKAIAEATDEFEKDWENPLTIQSSIGRFVMINEAEELRHFQDRVMARHPGNSDIACEFGDAYEYLSDLEAAMAAYQHGFDQDPEHKCCCEGIARGFMLQGKPDMAEPLLLHIVDNGEPDKANLLYALAQCYQGVGNHSKALIFFDQCEALLPSLAQEKSFNKHRELSRKHLSTGKPISHKTLGFRSTGEFNKGPLVVIALALVVGLMVWLAACFWIGAHRKIYLVNGLDYPYSLVINGSKQLSLPSTEAVPIRISEGEVKVAVTSSSLSIPEQEFTVETSFLSRPFKKPVFVINPDGTALIALTHHHYTDKDRYDEHLATDPNYMLATFHNFPVIDYPFSDAPKSIKVSSGSNSPVKSTLHIVDTAHELSGGSEGVFAIDQLMASNEEVVAEYARKKVQWSPDRLDFIAVYASSVPLDEFTSWSKPRLEARPLEIKFHRIYQQILEKKSTTATEAQYAALQAADPQDPDLMYLLARVTEDPDLALDRLNRAIELGNKTYAYLGRGYYYFTNGNYKDAAADYKAAMATLSEDEVPREQLIQIMIAAGNYGEALELMNRQIAVDPDDFSNLYYKAYLLELMNREAEANAATEEIKNMARTEGNEHSEKLVAQRVSDLRSLARGEYQKVYDSWATSSEDWQKFLGLLIQDKLSAAEHVFPAEELGIAGNAMLAIKHHKIGDQAAVQRYLQEIIKGLQKDSRYRHYVDALSGKLAWPADKLARLAVDINVKLPVLILLGEIYPEQRDIYWPLAKKLNFDRRRTNYLYESLLKS